GLSWVELGGLRFEDVSIEDTSGVRIARLGSLQIDLSWLRALSNPRAAIARVRAAGVEVELGLDALSRLYASRHAGESGAASPEPAAPEQAASAKLPSLAIEGARLKLHDGEGPLVVAELSRLVVDDARWEAELARCELGSATGEFASFEDVRASGPRVGQRPQVARANAGAATLVASAPEGDSASRARPKLIDRLRKARSALLGDEKPTAATTAAPRPSLWTPDARLELHGTRVLEGPGTSGPAILEQLNLELLAEGTTSVRVKGDGVTAASGSLFWDVHVTPEDAKVEGRVTLRAVPLALFTPVLPALPFHELEHTRVAADVSVTAQGLARASVRGDLSISDLAFASEGLARAPVGPIELSANGEATWTPALRELSDLRGELTSGAAHVLVSGALAWPKDAYRVDLRAEMPKVKCQDALDVVPAGLLDELSEMQMGGSIQAKVDVHVDSADLDATKVDFDFVDRCRFSRLPELMSIKRFSQPFTHHVVEPDGTLFEMKTGPGTPAWTPIEEISPFMIQAIVSSEDGRFFKHHGFAESQIGPALARNLQAHAFKFGASTVTMQLVKNVFLHRDKLLARKGQEALIVWWLERAVDKKWILELYLNVIEYGTSVYGIRQASQHYFGTEPLQLSPARAAFLASVLPRPKSYDKQYAIGRPDASTKKRVAALLKHMRKRERIDDEALAYGLEEIEQLEFYHPDQPLPTPPEMRGAALAPPFQTAPIDGWNTFEAEPKVEDEGAILGI
ncbi:MAG TPA: transglycosylase domain-containing protein, partial [Polyangiaceae bacterium]|nr:transglycosylase domain-containing protein [Polyangiaceae bacterium]